jgi:hypothetical protein
MDRIDDASRRLLGELMSTQVVAKTSRGAVGQSGYIGPCTRASPPIEELPYP